jgi:ABC-2 type transport system ATP-binding protein
MNNPLWKRKIDMAQANENSIELINATYEHIPGVGVYDLNLRVPGGSIFGLIGPSGCGKTTTVRMLLGLLRAQKGQARLFGLDSAHLSTRSREQIGYMPQRFVLYPDLTVNENLRFASSLYGISIFKRGDLIRNMLKTVELSEASNRLANDLSGGMQRRLELAASLLHQPQLLFADEPTSGIDPVLRASLWDYLRAYRNQGKTLFVTTQYVGEASFCDVVGVMDKGRLLYVDTPENLYRQALGGEVVTITVDPSQVYNLMGVLRQEQRIMRVDTVPGDPGTLHLTVSNAGEMIPDIMELTQRANLQVQQVNRFEPNFDEIFTTLIRRGQRERAA